jgi:hypothetical protein
VRGHLLAVLALATTLAACGGSDDPATPASADRPLASKPTDPATSSDPARLNEAESTTANSTADTPVCELVSVAQARAILGAPVSRPVVAPQGPTCIYKARTPKGENPREGFVTVAVQHRDLGAARKQLSRARRVDIGGRTGFCGEAGQPTLYVAVSDDRVLEIVGSCATAKRFAAQAAKRLEG